jgi:hypothetical protein
MQEAVVELAELAAAFLRSTTRDKEEGRCFAFSWPVSQRLVS